jgi:hypothetical protein
MGLHRTAFDLLLQTFELYWIGRRKRVFAAVDIPGVVFHWTNSRMAQKNLYQIFEVTQGYVSYSIELVADALCRAIRAIS